MARNFKTKLTSLLSVDSPIVCAPMAGASGALLASQVTLGGGFGFIAAGYDAPEAFERELLVARSELNIPPGETLPIGVGFLVWQLEKAGLSESPTLNLTLQHGVKAVWFAFGENLQLWIEQVRAHDRVSGHRTIVFVQVTSLAEAQLALHGWKVDVLVVQGIESGGHGSSEALPLLTFLLEVLSIVPEDGPPVLAAGGLASGVHLASVLAAGASGAVFGTRFLLSPESLYTDAQRLALVNAKSDSTVRTLAFDQVRGTVGWPHNVDGRALTNLTVEEFNQGEDLEELRKKWQEGTKEGNPERMLVWAGMGVGMMTSVMPAKDILKEIHHDCLRRIEKLPGLLG
ncbi:2-nitropropane dioxygenase [Pluteus cervinus]|uniref:2-nitropropane dioxygenase n=1 Tax=Pluteus cervinus TaxID=181527 RepID=A0ACD3B1A4_9AGAR|nr:2-nitropropane dioxygenase [Pluteus cervinus]